MPDVVYYDFAKEVNQIGIVLNAEADLLAERLKLKINQMIASGMTKSKILEVLKNDLRTGGQLFSGFNSTFRRNISPTVDMIAQGQVVKRNPANDKWEWVTTSAEPCDDCKPRHGKVKTYEQWRGLGLPRSGFSVCGENCKCALVPAVQVGSSIEDGPVEVDQLAKARADFQERMKTDSALKAKMEAYRAELREKRSALRK